VTSGQPAADASSQISVVADPLVARGGCMVRSDFGFMDVSPESQFEELARNLLEDTEPVPSHAVVPVAAVAATKPSEGALAD
jgi:flagellar biosynthesis/type III secretory pathway protein FliH